MIVISTNDNVSSCDHIVLSDHLFEPTVIVPGTPTAGEDFIVTCRLDGVVERLVVGRINLILPGANLLGQTPIGTPIVVTQQFTPVTTSDAKLYSCVASVSGTTSGIFFESTIVGELFVQSNAML